ncbi:MAG: NUDIX hydrolase [Thermomicrobiales bacterium]
MTGSTSDEPSRDFTVAVFVVSEARVLLHFHTKLDRWLPPGGHVEPNELPDNAARREVFEETGISIEIVGDQLNATAIAGQPEQLCRPAGVQITRIGGSHEHIDIVYFAKYVSGSPSAGSAWFDPNSWESLKLTEEVLGWCNAAIAAVDRWTPPVSRVRT